MLCLDQLTLGRLSALSEDELQELRAEGLDLGAVEAVDLCGLQLILSVCRDENGADRVAGTLAGTNAPNLLKDAGFLSGGPSDEAAADAKFWGTLL